MFVPSLPHTTLRLLAIVLLATLAALPGTASAKGKAKQSASAKSDSANTPVYDTLAGNLPAVILARKHPYLVVADIYVPQGKRVSLEAGAVLLFQNFTSLHVMGTLSAKATKEYPIIFTSVNDKEHNPRSALDPAPFDWNGIFFHEDAFGSELSYCAVLYSVEGITSMTKFIRLSPCLFLHNGRTSLTIEGEVHQVTEEPYEYALSKGDPALDGIPVTIIRDPRARAKNIMRLSGIGLAVGGCVLGVFYASRYDGSLGAFRELSNTDSNNLSDNSSTDWHNAQDRKNRDLAAMVAGFSIAAVGGIALTLSIGF